MTVFLVSATKTDKDLQPALQYGDLHRVTQYFVYGDEIADDQSLPANVEAALDRAALRFDSQTDYLLLVGDQLQLAALAAKLGARNSTFRVLRWDRQAAGYIPVSISA